jgi:hypothetical protein
MISACSAFESNDLNVQFFGPDSSTMLASPQSCAPKHLTPITPQQLADLMSASSTPTGSVADFDVNINRKSSLGEERRRVWVHGPRPEYKKNSQRYNLPSRIIPLLRPNLDMVILPGGHAPTKEFWDFCKVTLGFQEWQALFTSGSVYNMDDNICEDMIDCMKTIMLKDSRGWTLVPYCVTPNFKRWASLLVQGLGKDIDIQIFGDELDWVDRFGHKGVLHRHMRSLDTPR